MESRLQAPEYLRESVSRLLDALRQQTGVLYILAGAMKKPANVTEVWPNGDVPDAVVRTVPLMLHSLGMSVHSIGKLAEFPWVHTRDSYVVVRSFLELAVNICYIVARGSDAAERALQHTLQKAYRDLDRESKIGNDIIRLYVASPPDPATVKGLPEALSEFSNKSGGEKQHWIDDSIDQRIAVAGALDSGILSDLHFARFIVYRHASEIIHGTHFGVHFCLGLTTPGRDSQIDSMEHMGDQQVMLLLACNLAASAVCKIFHVVYGSAVTETLREANFRKALEALVYYASRAETPAQDLAGP